MRGLFDSFRRSAMAWPLTIAALWAAMVVAFEWIKPTHYDGPSLCMFRNITGVPCPTCGSTRAVQALGRGDISQAFLLQPLLIMTLAIIPVWMLLRTLRKHRSASEAQLSSTRWWGLLALLALNWMYLIWSGR